MTYRATAKADAEAARATAGAPLYDFTTPDGVQHTVWRVAAADARATVDAFARIPALYIADGHHRAASAARARAALQTQVGGGIADAETFIAVAFPHDQMQILPYNRTVKDLAGRSPEAFLAALRETVQRRPMARPARRAARARCRCTWLAAGMPSISPAPGPKTTPARAVSMWRCCSGTSSSSCSASATSGPTSGSISLAAPVAPAGLERAVDSGAAAVAFSMYPVTIDDLMAISDAGGIMPPKSTWFEPKLRDGLLVHLI